jgi:hypothetical protein
LSQTDGHIAYPYIRRIHQCHIFHEWNGFCQSVNQPQQRGTLAFIALAFEDTGNLQYSGLGSIFKFNEWHLFVIRGVVNHEFKIQTFFAMMHYFIFVGTKVFLYGKVGTKNCIHTFAYYWNWMLHLLAHCLHKLE